MLSMLVGGMRASQCAYAQHSCKRHFPSALAVEKSAVWLHPPLLPCASLLVYLLLAAIRVTHIRLFGILQAEHRHSKDRRSARTCGRPAGRPLLGGDGGSGRCQGALWRA